MKGTVNCIRQLCPMTSCICTVITVTETATIWLWILLKRLLYFSRSPLADDQWHHVAISMPFNSCKYSEINLYVDGVKKDFVQRKGTDRHKEDGRLNICRKSRLRYTNKCRWSSITQFRRRGRWCDDLVKGSRASRNFESFMSKQQDFQIWIEEW